MRVILSRELGAEALGLYQISLSFFYVLLTIVSSGIPSTISHLSARYKVSNNKKAEGSAVTSSLIIGIIASIILEILLFCFKDLIIKMTTKECFTIILCLSPSIFITAGYSSFRGALWGRQRHTPNCIAEIGEQLTRFILFVVLLSTAPTPIIGAIRAGVCYSISCLVSLTISIIFYFKNGSILYSPKSTFKQVFKSSLPITCLRLLSSLLQPIIAVIIPFELQCAGYTEAESIGLFGIITGMTMPLLSLPDTLIGSYATALIPEISTSVVKNDKNELIQKVKSSICFTLFICFSFVPIYFGAGKQIGSLLFNNMTSGYLLTKSSFIMVPMGINNITQSILNSIELEFKSFKNYIVGSILLILCILFLPRYFGVDSLIIGTAISFSLSGYLNIRMISKYLQIKGIILKPLLLMSLFVIPSSMLGSFICNIFKCITPQFITVCLSCACSLVSFVLLCYVFNIINISTFIVSFKKMRNIKVMKKKQKKAIV